jgi:hypothetical protein
LQIKLECQQVKIEKVKELDNGLKIWAVELIHPLITRNGREYPKEELQKAARSWSFRPLNINHDENRWLYFNWQNPLAPDSNATQQIEYDENRDAVYGPIQVIDPVINGRLERKEIATVSIEQFPSKGESCSCGEVCKCVQHGVIGSALALLETFQGVEPGDPQTKIAKLETSFCTAARSSSTYTYDTSQFQNLVSSTQQMSEQTVTAPAKSEAANVKDKDAEVKVPGVLENRIVGFSPEQFDRLIKNSEQKQIEALEKALGVFKTTTEKLIEQYTPKAPATATAIPVGDAKPTKEMLRTEALKNVADFVGRVLRREALTPISYKMDLHDFLAEHGYDPDLDDRTKRPAKEALTTGTNPINYVRRALVLPGGVTDMPIRQYTDYQVKGDGNAEVAWYTIDQFEFVSLSAGSAPSEASPTISQIKAAPGMKGAYLKLDYDKVEDNAFPLVAQLNELAQRAAIRAEGTEVLSTIADAVSLGTGQWFNGNTGSGISSDDTSGMTLTIDGVSAAKTALDVEGYGGEGPYVFAIHPKAYNELIVDSGIEVFTQQGIPEVTRTGMLQTLLGVQLMQCTQVKHKDNTTNDTYRNIMFVPGRSFALASGRELTIAVEPHSELSQFYWVPSHRIAGKCKDEASIARVSTDAPAV